MLLLVGCTGLRPPAISVNEVAVADTTEEALALAIMVELRNPNTSPLELYEFRYTVAVDGRQVYTGRRAGAATLSAVGHRTITLPAVVPYPDAGWQSGDLPASASCTVRGRLQYNAPSDIAGILFDTGVRRPKVRFSRKMPLDISGK